jgi:hypothetical protein
MVNLLRGDYRKRGKEKTGPEEALYNEPVQAVQNSTKLINKLVTHGSL